MKTLSRQWVTIASAGIVVLVMGVAVLAHAKLEKTEPVDGSTVTAAPKFVQLWFNEILDVKVSKMALSGPSGKVELGPVHSMEPKSLMAGISGKMADGTYAVDWQTAGDDGHVQKGKFGFTLKQAH